MTSCLLLAQADPLSGGAGWVGAGLLGAVLFWLLLKHLPDKDKLLTDHLAVKDSQIARLVLHNDELLQAKDERIDAQRAEFTKTLAELATAFKAEAAAERQACEKHFGTLAETMNRAFQTLGSQLAAQAEQIASHSERNRQWVDLLKKEIESRKIGSSSGKGG